jgi:metal-dependent amidase/aminoacylase/carboxypeptidase family protein
MKKRFPGAISGKQYLIAEGCLDDVDAVLSVM